eukprot:5426219-Pyramimonas_sp.AAC.1
MSLALPSRSGPDFPGRCPHRSRLASAGHSVAPAVQGLTNRLQKTIHNNEVLKLRFKFQSARARELKTALKQRGKHIETAPGKHETSRIGRPRQFEG